MRRVLFVAGHHLDVGGVEAYLLSLARSIGRRFEIFLAADCTKGLEDRASRAAIGVIPWKTSFPRDELATHGLQRIAEACRADLMHVQDLPSAITAGGAARRLGLPVVRTVHLPAGETAGDGGLRAWLRRKYYAALERHTHHHVANRVIFVAHSALERALASGAVPRQAAWYIPNGVGRARLSSASEARARSLRARLGTPAGSVVLCFAGRLERQKGIDTLLGALSLLHPRKHVAVWVVGEGSDRARLEDLCRRRSLNDTVRFLGHSQDVRPIFRAADGFVLPSRFEGMPIALLEAMATGLPCIVSDVGDCASIVREAKCGLVVPKDDPAELARAVRTFLTYAERRRAWATAARQAASAYDLRLTGDATVAVYASVGVRSWP